MPELTPDVERELAALDDALAGRRVAPDLTELGELALALREERPLPTGEFGAELDAKVARGFGEPGPRRASGRRWWAGWMAPALAATATAMLIAVVVVSGPTGSAPKSASARSSMRSWSGGSGIRAPAARPSPRGGACC